MIKVKEFLDEHFDSGYPSTAMLKDNGHYSVHGSWNYTKGEYYVENFGGRTGETIDK